jgi:hypothetical protein
MTQCPLWVKSGHLQRKTACPLYLESGRVQRTRQCLPWAKSGHSAIHSIILSARASSVSVHTVVRFLKEPALVTSVL